MNLFRKMIHSTKNLGIITRSVLGINERNLQFVYPYNSRRFSPLADDKLKTKIAMEKTGVPVPFTFKTYRYFYELKDFERDLSPHPEFVIKPAKGAGGSGIIVVSGKKGAEWTGMGGKTYDASALRKHISDIVFGVFCHDLHDTAIIEERLKQHPDLDRLSPGGLADIRILLFQDEPVMTMIRIPTRKSKGRANLHQGGIGVGIDLSSGMTTHAIREGRPVLNHPDSGSPLLEFRIPFWKEVLTISRAAARAVPLKYIGADIALTVNGPVLLEINVRPGLEIQNANRSGLKERLTGIESDTPDA